MLVRELISKSWYLSGIVSRRLETVDGTQSSDGLEILNDILAEKSGSGRGIPFYTQIQIASVTDQSKYTVPNLIILDTITYNIKTIRYAMKRDSRYRHWGTPRADDISSLPRNYYSERVLGGMTFDVYFSPIADIDFFTITGRFGLPDLGLDTDFDTVLDAYYQSYLKYKLAVRLAEFYGFPVSPSVMKTMLELEEYTKDVNEIDFTMKKVSTLSQRHSPNYGQANLGHGWTVP